MMLISNPSATSARPKHSTPQSLPVTAVGLRVDNPDKPRQEIELAGGVELPGNQASSLEGRCGQPALLENEAGDFVDPLSALQIGKNERPRSSHSSGV